MTKRRTNTPLFKVIWTEKYELETVIEGRSVEEVRESASFFTDGWLMECAEECDINVKLKDLVFEEVEALSSQME